MKKFTCILQFRSDSDQSGFSGCFYALRQFAGRLFLKKFLEEHDDGDGY